MNKKKLFTAVAVTLVALVVLAVYSFVPQNNLESYFPEIENEIQTFVSQERKDEARENIKKLESELIALNKDKRYSHFTQIALNYKLLGEKEKVRDYLIRAAEEDEEKVSVYLEFGKIYSKDGQLNEAEKMYKKAVELEPESVYTQVSLLEFYLEHFRDRESQIQDAFNYARETTGENDQVLLLYAGWLEERGENIRAIDIYKFVLNNSAGDPYNIETKIEEIFDLVTQ